MTVTEMTRYRQFIHALEAGDPESAVVFWKSANWTPQERARARRLVKSAGGLVLPPVKASQPVMIREP